MTEIERLVEGKKWGRARALIQEAMLSAPMDHWLWMTLSLTYYEQRQYEKALQCSTRAIELQPDCPLALWHYAGDLFMNGREDAALTMWTMLRDMDIEKVAYDDCGEGMDWALRLINDAQYRIGRYYQWKKKPEQARVSFEKYVHNRKHGVSSTYDVEEVKKYLASLPTDGNGEATRKSGKRTVKR